MKLVKWLTEKNGKITIRAIYDSFLLEMGNKAEMIDNPEYRLAKCGKCGAEPEINHGKNSGKYFCFHNYGCPARDMGSIYADTREQLIIEWEKSIL